MWLTVVDPEHTQVSSRERPDSKVRHPRNSHGKLIVSLVDPEGGVNVAVEMLLGESPRLDNVTNIPGSGLCAPPCGREVGGQVTPLGASLPL